VSSLSAPRSTHLSPRQAVDRLRDLVHGNEFEAFAAVDRVSGEPVQAEARTLFAALPTLSPATSVEELIEHGILMAPPRGLRRALDAPRYRAGREVFVRTHANHRQLDKHQPVGAFLASAAEAFTHRAVLVGQRGDTFLVTLEGASSPIAVSRQNLFAWNEPTPIAATGASFSGVQIDYTDALMKAHVCAAHLDIAPDLERLDLSAEGDMAQKAQAQLVRRITSRVHMDYLGKGQGYTGPRAAPLLSGGQGVAFALRAAMAGLLAPFARTIGFDLQLAYGRTLRLAAPHAFVVLTLRPSLARYVVDPAWKEPLTDLRVAFFGPGWAHDRRLEGFEGTPDVRVRADAIDLPTTEST
jgi:hypothetical protein